MRRERLLAEFMDLVQIDSETKHEEEISKVLKGKFGILGLEVTEDDTASKTGHGSGNLFAWLPATRGLQNVPGLLFTSHMDTVSPGKGITRRLDEDGYIRSDGTTILGSDDKAGVAAIFEAIRVLQENGLPHGSIQIVITAGEESGMVGSRAMDGSLLRAQYGFGEARSRDPKKLDQVVESMREAAESAAREHRATVEFENVVICPAYRFSDGDEVVKIAKSAISAIGLEPRPFDTSGGSDANLFNGCGVPTVNLAVGYEDIHTTNERIKADDIVKVTEFVLAIVSETMKRGQ